MVNRLIFLFLIFILSNCDISHANDRYIKEDIKKEYKGVIIEKYYSKATHLKIKINKETLDISGLSEKMIVLSEVGDSIIKFKM